MRMLSFRPLGGRKEHFTGLDDHVLSNGGSRNSLENLGIFIVILCDSKILLIRSLKTLVVVVFVGSGLGSSEIGSSLRVSQVVEPR